MPDERSESDDVNKDRAKTYQVCAESRNDCPLADVERIEARLQKNVAFLAAPPRPLNPNEGISDETLNLCRRAADGACFRGRM